MAPGQDMSGHCQMLCLRVSSQRRNTSPASPVRICEARPFRRLLSDRVTMRTPKGFAQWSSHSFLHRVTCQGDRAPQAAPLLSQLVGQDAPPPGFACLKISVGEFWERRRPAPEDGSTTLTRDVRLCTSQAAAFLHHVTCRGGSCARNDGLGDFCRSGL